MTKILFRTNYFVGIIAAFFFIIPCYPCTSFILREGKHPFLAKNFDYFIGEGIIFINQRNDAKAVACILPEKPARWVSKYGSITFNLYGKDLPISGMNEAGLVIESLWLDNTRYPEPDERMALPELGWVQFMLDHCASVDEVITFDRQVRIANTSLAKIHFMVLDADGHSAVFEMVEGKTHITRSTDLTPEVLENQTYSGSLDFMKNNPLGVKCYTLPINDKRERFEMVAQMLEDKNAGEYPLAYSFKVLQKVTWITENGDAPTQWSVVYNPELKSIHYKTRQNSQIKSISLSDFNFQCSDELKIFPLHAEVPSVKSTDLKKYTIDEARMHLKQVFASVPFTKVKITDDMVNYILQTSAKAKCQ